MRRAWGALGGLHTGLGGRGRVGRVTVHCRRSTASSTRWREGQDQQVRMRVSGLAWTFSFTYRVSTYAEPTCAMGA